MPTVYNKVTAGNQTIIDLSQDTVTQASHIMAGYVGHLADGTQVEGTGSGGGGTYQAKTNINPTTSSQTITPDTGYDALSSVQINAMPSGTAGTPTATKGTVSNHSVSVTPSVTNTTGYITGSTKAGTAVTVSASELVSGSETKTANGTYDVTNLAQLIVNVSGGGGSGLVYESGTYTPTSNQSSATINFAQSHSTLPFMYIIAMQNSEVPTQNSVTLNIYLCFSDVFGGTYKKESSTTIYGLNHKWYKSASSISSTGTDLTHPTSDQDSGTAYPRHYISESQIKFESGNTNRVLRSGITYKWIAVWAPTT